MISFPFIANESTDEDGTVTYDRAESVSSRRNLNQLDRTEGVDMKNPNAFLVLAGTSMTVIVTGSTGTTIERQAWAQVAGTMANEEEESRTLAIEASDTLDRIDRVVLRKDDADAARDVDLYIVKGTPAASPIAPELTRNTTVWEIALADVFIPKNSTAVSQSYITDQRLNDEVCGQMGSYFDNPDFSPYFLQISALIADYQADATQSLADLQAAIDSIVAGTGTMTKLEYDPDGKGIDVTIQTYTHTTTTDDDGNVTHTLTGAGENGKFKSTASGTVVTVQVGTADDYATCTIVAGDDTELEVVEGRWYQFILDGAVLNFTKGGASLNYKIFASTTEPTDPAEGTIWIENDTEVGKVQIGAEKPTTRANGTDLQDGDVFLQTGGSEYTEITISDGLGVSILSVSQWSSETESWLYVVGYVRKNETWQSLLYAMYYGGIDYVLFGDDFSSDKSVTAAGSSSGNSAVSIYMSEQLVDLTNLSTLYFQYSGFRCNNSATTTSARATVRTDELTSDQAITTDTSSLSNTISLDVSSATGLQLVGFGLTATTSITTASTAYITPIAFWGI